MTQPAIRVEFDRDQFIEEWCVLEKSASISQDKLHCAAFAWLAAQNAKWLNVPQFPPGEMDALGDYGEELACLGEDGPYLEVAIYGLRLKQVIEAALRPIRNMG